MWTQWSAWEWSETSAAAAFPPPADVLWHNLCTHWWASLCFQTGCSERQRWPLVWEYQSSSTQLEQPWCFHIQTVGWIPGRGIPVTSRKPCTAGKYARLVSSWSLSTNSKSISLFNKLLTIYFVTSHHTWVVYALVENNWLMLSRLGRQTGLKQITRPLIDFHRCSFYVLTNLVKRLSL